MSVVRVHVGEPFSRHTNQVAQLFNEAPIGASWSGFRFFSVVSRGFATAATGTDSPAPLPRENGESAAGPPRLRNGSLWAQNGRRVGGESAPVFNSASEVVLR